MAASIRYETLLKPAQENLLKDWGLTVSLLLDDFMSHLEDQTQMNFSEAALLLQNSTTFYCRRVDVLHKIVHELFNVVCNIRSSEKNDGHTEQDGPSNAKKKKKVKSLEMDDLQLLDFVFSEHNINCDVDKVIAQGSIKQIVLNTNIKAPRKPGTSINVFQSDGKLLGCKEEFRMFGFLHSNGTINEDFNYDPGKIITCIDESIVQNDEWDAEPLPQCDAEIPPVDLIKNLVPEDNPFDTGLADQNTLIDEMPNDPSLPMVSRELNAAAKPKTVKKNFDWEHIPYDFKFPLKPLKCESIILFPKQLLALADKESDPQELKNARKKRKRGKAVVEEPEEVNIMWIDKAIRSGSVNAVVRKLEIEKARRKVVISSSRPTVRDPYNIMGDVDDADDPDDFEAYVDDNEVPAATPFTRLDELIHAEDQPGTYQDEALKAIEKFKERRKQTASQATEVAKRVAAWHEKIAPVLEAAESRSHFDVHEYGTRILALFPDDDLATYRPFGSVVVAQPKLEICRYFLSSLMLANTYNLEIRKSSDEFLAQDCVELRLLSKVRHHEEMDEAMRVTSEECGA